MALKSTIFKVNLQIADIDNSYYADHTLVLARLFQILLARANEKGILSAGKLIEESQSASFLRRNH